MVLKEARSEVSSLWARGASKGAKSTPQPCWVSLAGRRHPSKREKVGEEMEQDTEREGGGGKRGPDTEKEKAEEESKQQHPRDARCQGRCLRPSRFPEEPLSHPPPYSAQTCQSVTHPSSEFLCRWGEVGASF